MNGIINGDKHIELHNRITCIVRNMKIGVKRRICGDPALLYGMFVSTSGMMGQEPPERILAFWHQRVFPSISLNVLSVDEIVFCRIFGFSTLTDMIPSNGL